MDSFEDILYLHNKVRPKGIQIKTTIPKFAVLEVRFLGLIVFQPGLAPP